MITIKNCWIRKGYSAEDHLNRPITHHIGRQFRSVGEAREAIFAASVRDGDNMTRSPIGVEVIYANGETKVI